MNYILYWKDTFGRECRCERPETWENIEHVLNAVRKSGHYQKGSFRVDFVSENDGKEDV